MSPQEFIVPVTVPTRGHTSRRRGVAVAVGGPGGSTSPTGHPSRRRALAVTAATALALSLLGCTSPDSPAPINPVTGPGDASAVLAGVASPATVATTYGGVTLGTPPCYVDLPEEWRQAVARGALWTDENAPLGGAPSYDGSGVVAVTAPGVDPARFSIQGAGRQLVENLGSVANPSGAGGLLASAMDDRHVVLAYSFPPPETGAADLWAIFVADRLTGEFKQIAHNPVGDDGLGLGMAWVDPVMTSDDVYWIQRPQDTSDWGAGDLMQYSFATGQTRLLYHSPQAGWVPYGDKLVFGALGPGVSRPPEDLSTPYPKVMRAVDQATGEPAEVPPGLDFTATGVGNGGAVSDGDLVVWASSSYELKAWRAAWGKSVTLVPSFDHWTWGRSLPVYHVDYPQLYGHFLFWDGGWVLDLTTNSFAALGAVAAGGAPTITGDWLAWWELGKSESGTRTYTQYLIELKGLPDLPSCPTGTTG